MQNTDSITENVHVVHSVLSIRTEELLKLQNEQHISIFCLFLKMRVVHILTEKHFVGSFYQGYTFFARLWCSVIELSEVI